MGSPVVTRAFFCLLLNILFASQTFAAPPVVMDVRWLRTPGLPEVRDNACWVAVADVDEDSIAAMGAQLQWCVMQGKPLVSELPPAGSLRIRWHQVTRAEMRDAIATHSTTADSRTRAAAGHYAIVGRECLVYTIAPAHAGHEVKHCFDGDFHYAPGRDAFGNQLLGRWKQR